MNKTADTLPGGLSDEEIVRRVRNGDIDAFEQIIARYKNYVAAIASRHVPESEVEEMAQEIFIKAYKSLPSYTGRGELKPWIATISARTCCDYWRKRYRSGEINFSSLDESHQQWLEATIADTSSDHHDARIRHREARETLEAALKRLDPEDRMILEMVYLEEMSIREAARATGWSTSNVKVRAFRARKKMFKFLSDTTAKQGEGL